MWSFFQKSPNLGPKMAYNKKISLYKPPLKFGFTYDSRHVISNFFKNAFLVKNGKLVTFSKKIQIWDPKWPQIKKFYFTDPL